MLSSHTAPQLQCILQRHGDTTSTVRSGCRRSRPPQGGPGQAVIKILLLEGQTAASREGPHHVPQGECLGSHKDMGLGTSLLSTMQVLVRGQMECASLQSLTKGRVGQNAAITGPTVPPNIDDTEPISRVHNCQEDS
ncbi:hypothetical protein XENOCAPTIV_024113 [Xenoophorus captivus]|uniref:Uncharacterized protein n=1 Tax=Xenoophorus captivus TaxID=1517983 RepID=A0ABV0RSI3_9TELE